MLILNERQVQQCLLLNECLQVNRQAFIALAQGHATVPTRLALPYSSTTSLSTATPDWTLFKPAATPNSMGCKIVSVRSNNPATGLPLVPATIVQIHAETGIVEAVLAATYLTAARTAAGSALATAVAWHGRTVQHVVLIGAGLQAQLHVQMIAEALAQTHLPELTIINRTLERADSLRDKIQSMCANGTLAFQTIDRYNIVPLYDTARVAEALSTASCIVTCTNTATPLFDNVQLSTGCHINSAGSYTPDMQEIPTDTIVQQCRVWMDTTEARSVGDLKHVPTDHPVKLLGEVLLENGDLYNDSQLPCTFYKSVGTAIQDVMTARIVVDKARELGIGTIVDMN